MSLTIADDDARTGGNRHSRRNASRAVRYPAGMDDETTLVERAQRGDMGAFTVLMDAHLPQVRRFLAIRAPVAHLADELAHDTFVFAYRNLRGFAAGTDFAAWLLSIAANTLRAEVQRFARQRRHLQRYAELRVLEAAADGEDQGDCRHDRLVRCLAKLPGHLRELVDLKYRAQRSTEEMAEQLGRSCAWVRTTLFRIREQLRECLQLDGRA